MHLFVRVADLGSFAAAANQLGVARSVVTAVDTAGRSVLFAGTVVVIALLLSYIVANTTQNLRTRHIAQGFGFLGTTSALDEAYKKFIKVRQLTLEMAELENSIYRLAYFIKKAQKRANALHNIVIPGLDEDIARIGEELEEKEREEFVRLKVIKAQKKTKAQMKA